MSIEDYLEQTLLQLEQIYAQMDKATGNLLLRDVGPYKQFRHDTQTESLACYLRGIKTISTLNACVVLLRLRY